MSLMPQIFGNSSQVAIWLGEANANDDWALDVIEQIDNLLRSEDRDESIWSLAATVRQVQGQDVYPRLASFLGKEWWSRIWVVQEALMAPQAALLYGTRSLDLHTVARIVAHFPDVVNVMQHLVPFQNSAALWYSPAWKRVTGLVTERETYLREHQLLFSRLVCSTRYRKYYDDRDRFYSLLGMAPLDIGVDYACPIEQCIPNIFAVAMQKELSLDLLSFISHGEHERRDLRLPSWASLCTWDEDFPHPVPLLEPDDHTVGHRPFAACPHPLSATFELPDRMAVDSWYVSILRCERGLQSFLEHWCGQENQSSLEQLRATGLGRYSSERVQFQCDDGLICLAPSESRKDDQVRMFAGGKTPYIVRQKGKEYSFIGEW